MGKLSYIGDKFYLNGKPYTIASGALHYFRIHPEYWRDSLEKLKACGFNTVETYTCWNLHEKKEGEFDFSGQLDIGKFISTAQEVGLNVILRPGPFICAEWDLGGLPAWLFKIPGMKFRCFNKLFLEKVNNYLKELFTRLDYLMAKNGGPIFMIQIENEYGSFGNDRKYMQAIADIYKGCKIEELLFTSDGSENNMITGGMMDGYMAAVNMGGDPKGNFERLQKRGRTHPLMVGEFWCGQFDHWYEAHNRMDKAFVAEQVDDILSLGASFNIYMFQGGTNFGFNNGANYLKGAYCPDTTSYDYDALLDEAGNRTPKYFEVQKVLEKHFGKTGGDMDVKDRKAQGYGVVQLTEQAALFDTLDTLSAPVASAAPLNMEELGQNFGFILYTTYLRGPLDKSEIRIYGLHDRALIYLDGRLQGIKQRDRQDDSVTVELGFGQNAKLDILVENMGRINFGPLIEYEKKGITGHVELYHGVIAQTIFDWNIRCLPLDNIQDIHWGEAADRIPETVFLRGRFRVDKKADTYLYLPGFKRGVAFINGFNLGRYCSDGPQQTLYIPAPVLNSGENEIVIFEQERPEKAQVQMIEHPILDDLEAKE